jgi:hypothetical protein
MKEVARKPDGVRWCFHCRKQREFEFIVHAPVEEFSYYGASPSVRCSVCGQIDGDLFPGGCREWED